MKHINLPLKTKLAIKLEQLKSMDLQQVLCCWQIIDSMPCNKIEIADVRGWIMDELERRNPVAFEKWIDSCEDNPEPFFMPTDILTAIPV
jgi:hypothetical protein